MPSAPIKLAVPAVTLMGEVELPAAAGAGRDVWEQTFEYAKPSEIKRTGYIEMILSSHSPPEKVFDLGVAISGSPNTSCKLEWDNTRRPLLLQRGTGLTIIGREGGGGVKYTVVMRSP